jgi:outer membrane protease
MKNIAVLPILVIIICVITANNSAFSQDFTEKSQYSFLYGELFGFVYGKSFELVYPVDTKGELLSELSWDMKPVFYYGMQLDFRRRDLMSAPGFFLTTSFKVGLPGDSGIMENRDWMSQENSSLTHFSTHTNRTNSFYWLDFAVGLSFPVKSYFYIKPFISGSFMHFSFTGRDGHGIYARQKSSNPVTYYHIDDDPRRMSFEGEEVIHYSQNWLLIAAGFSIGQQFHPNFSYNLSFRLSPFTYCAAVDEHIHRRILFYDFTGWGLYIEPGCKISFNKNRIILSYEFSYRHIGRTSGETYIQYLNSGSFFLAQGKAGAALSLFNSRLLFRVII